MMETNSCNIVDLFQVPLYKFNKEEVEIWSQLQHKKIVELYGVILDQENVCMFAEFIDGELLSPHLQYSQG